MSVTPYTPSSSQIVHEARVDFRQRVIQSMIHIVQYDKSLPIIAVELYSNGQKWVLPSDANVKVRWGKRDHTYVYTNVLGCNADRTIVYFEIIEQMTVFYGEHNPVLEVIIGESVACSSYIPFYIDRNPIQRSDIESEIIPSVVDMLEAEIRSKQDILVSGTNIKTINGQSILGSGNITVTADLSNYYTKSEIDTLLGAKQATLVSGTNIKTINGQSILGSGNVTITTDLSNYYTKSEIDTLLNSKVNVSTLSSYYTKTQIDTLLGNKQDTLVSGTDIKTIDGYEVLGSGDINLRYCRQVDSGFYKDAYFYLPNEWEEWLTAEPVPTKTWDQFLNALGITTTATSIFVYVAYGDSFADNLYYTHAYMVTKTSGTYNNRARGALYTSFKMYYDTAGVYMWSAYNIMRGTAIYSSNTSPLVKIAGIEIPDMTNYYTKTETDNLLSAKADDSNVVHLVGGGTISPSSMATNPNFRTDINGSKISIYDHPNRNSTISLSNSGLALTNSSYYTSSIDYTGFVSKWGRYASSGYRYAYDGIHRISNDTETNLYSFPNSAGTIALTSDLDSKQDTLVSGTNIKTVNGYSLLGSGNIDAVKKVLLYSGACGNSVLLNSNYTPATDFDILLVFLQYNGSDTQQSHCVIDASWMNNIDNSYNYNIHENVVKLKYNPDTHYLWNDNNNCQIYKVIGLKFNNA